VSKELSQWEVIYWSTDQGKSTIEQWFDALTHEQFKSIAKEVKLLELCGNLLKLPHSRSLKKGLFELRERKYGFRVYYAFLKNKIIILLHAGDKKTQDRDIDIARGRLDELARDEGG
jgi:putative addiction module killer protein